MDAFGTWVRRQYYVYFDNAASTKEYRVQLRGARTVLLWGIFLLLLMMVSFLTYDGTVGSSQDTVSLQQVQRSLQTFYQAMLGILAGLVTLVAPAIGASAVLTDRNRRFLELLLCSPMSGRYYLVGKLISSYRNILMLLILSIPMVAVGSLLGGATYGDVFKSFLVISIDGLVFASIGLALSAGATRLPPALVMSYWLTIIILVGSSMASVAVTFSAMRGLGPQEMSVFAMLSPFQVGMTVGTVTTLFGVEFPNWLLLIPLAGTVIELCLLGATSAMSTRTVRATVWFRILSLGLFAFFSGLLLGVGRIPGVRGSDIVYFVAIPLIFAGTGIPFVACFQTDGPQKFTYDGAPKLRNMFRALPSGALFFTLAAPLAALIGGVVHFALDGSFTGLPALAAYIFYVEGFYAVCWSVCRFTSQFAGSLHAARALALLFVTVPVVLSLTMLTDKSQEFLSPMYPMDAINSAAALAWGTILIVLATLLSFVKLSSFRQKLIENGLAETQPGTI